MNGSSVHERSYGKPGRASEWTAEISDGTDGGSRGNIILGNAGIRLSYFIERRQVCQLYGDAEWHLYLLRIVLPASLPSQLVGSIAFGRSSPGGFAQSWIDCASVATTCVISAWSTRNGQSWAHRLFKVQVCDQNSNLPISGLRMGVR